MDEGGCDERVSDRWSALVPFRTSSNRLSRPGSCGDERVVAFVGVIIRAASAAPAKDMTPSCRLFIISFIGGKSTIMIVCKGPEGTNRGGATIVRGVSPLWWELPDGPASATLTASPEMGPPEGMAYGDTDVNGPGGVAWKMRCLSGPRLPSQTSSGVWAWVSGCW